MSLGKISSNQYTSGLTPLPRQQPPEPTNKTQTPPQLTGEVIRSAPPNCMSRDRFISGGNGNPKPHITQGSVPGVLLPLSVSALNSAEVGEIETTSNVPSRSPSGSTVSYKEHVTFADYQNRIGREGLDDEGLNIVKDGKLAEAFTKLHFKCDDKGLFYNEKTGTIFFVVQTENRATLCFGGLGNGVAVKPTGLGKDEQKKLQSKLDMKSLKEAIRIFFGQSNVASEEAMAIGLALKEYAKNENITPVVVGHSHGGGLAQCAAQAASIDGVTFNAAPQGRGVRARLEGEGDKGKLIAYITKGDDIAHKKGVLAKLSRAIFKEKMQPKSIVDRDNTITLPSTTEKTGFGKKQYYRHNNFYDDIVALRGPQQDDSSATPGRVYALNPQEQPQKPSADEMDEMGIDYLG